LDITVNIHEAKTHLSRLLARVMGGEEIIIAKAGKPIAKLIPYATQIQHRVPGTAKGKIWISADFDEPLPEEVLEGFER
jgi:prevent-host-death family protein